MLREPLVGSTTRHKLLVATFVFFAAIESIVVAEAHGGHGILGALIYAALLAVPDDIVEAAHVEGASGLRIFFQIKLPLILPTLGLVTILTFVANFNAFDLVYSVKGALAGPNYATDILGTLFYRTFFGYQSQLGSPTMGAAVATLMFLVILAGVGLYFIGVQRKLTRFAL